MLPRSHDSALRPGTLDAAEVAAMEHDSLVKVLLAAVVSAIFDVDPGGLSAQYTVGFLHEFAAELWQSLIGFLCKGLNFHFCSIR